MAKRRSQAYRSTGAAAVAFIKWGRKDRWESGLKCLLNEAWEGPDCGYGTSRFSADTKALYPRSSDYIFGLFFKGLAFRWVGVSDPKLGLFP